MDQATVITFIITISTICAVILYFYIQHRKELANISAKKAIKDLDYHIRGGEKMHYQSNKVIAVNRNKSTPSPTSTVDYSNNTNDGFLTSMLIMNSLNDSDSHHSSHDSFDDTSSHSHSSSHDYSSSSDSSSYDSSSSDSSSYDSSSSDSNW
jgi:uncharacterized membrane protein YcgQ (UPF0703/DUF1980 family)